MHRFLVATAELTAPSPRLSAEALRHLKVLRLKAGETVELFDGAGRSRLFAYRGMAASGPVLEAAGEPACLPPPEFSLTLFACVTKGSRWDWTLEKATELGVTRIVPVISERTIVRLPPDERAAKRERWQRIAEEAARQSEAKWLPEISAAVDFPTALAEAAKRVTFVGAILRDSRRAPSLARAVRERLALSAARDLAVFVGPEGDFAPDELDALMRVAVPVSLGAAILRAETAAIYALSAVKAMVEDEGPSAAPCALDADIV